MIPRYSRPDVASLWSDQARFAIWLEVETAVVDALAEAGMVPADAANELRHKGKFDAPRILEIEKEVKHDVIAFLTNVAEYVGPSSRYVHRGMTSSDLLDTTLAIQLVRSSAIILRELDGARDAVLQRAEEFRHTPCIGRSHGIHAEPTTFGLKLLSWYSELTRARARLVVSAREVSVGKISGAVGTLSAIPPQVESQVLARFGLRPEPVATQIVARDRHASFFSALALLATSLERCCIEIRHLQRTEVREVEEEFTRGQKGSSAMPHKRNPVLSENLCGLARMMRSYAAASLDNVALWHERDISHSSVERIIAPDACELICFMLHRFAGIVRGMVVYPQRMRDHLESTRGLPFSGALLLLLVDRGVTREEAYRLVQRHALAAWEGGASLLERVSADEEIMARLSREDLTGVFSLESQLRHVDTIFERTMQACQEIPL